MGRSIITTDPGPQCHALPQVAVTKTFACEGKQAYSFVVYVGSRALSANDILHRSQACVPEHTYHRLMKNDVEASPDNFPDTPQEVTLFCTNDYLGISAHPEVRHAAAHCAMEYGMGPRSSPLICGYTELHRRLELDLCDLKDTEECILFPTGVRNDVELLLKQEIVVCLRWLEQTCASGTSCGIEKPSSSSHI